MKIVHHLLVAGTLGVLLIASPARAGDGDETTSDAGGGEATCTMHSQGSGFYVDCILRDTKRDGNYVRIEWRGPGNRHGKDDNEAGQGTAMQFRYTFPEETGDFFFKAVVDKGIWWPDGVGPERQLIAS